MEGPKENVRSRESRVFLCRQGGSSFTLRRFRSWLRHPVQPQPLRRTEEYPYVGRLTYFMMMKVLDYIRLTHVISNQLFRISDDSESKPLDGSASCVHGVSVTWIGSQLNYDENNDIVNLEFEPLKRSSRSIANTRNSIQHRSVVLRLRISPSLDVDTIQHV
jgi:hypothetical protein